MRIAVWALLLAAVSGLVAALSLFGLKGWLLHTAENANPKAGASGHKNHAELLSGVDATARGQLIATVVVALALALAGRAAWSGRYWGRWAVIGLWLLASLTGTFVGFTWIISLPQSQPLAFKIPAVLAAISFVVAVVLTNVRPSIAYFNLTRPARPSGRPAGRRGGLFSIGDQVRGAESLPGSSPIRGRSRGARIAAARAASARPEAGRGDAARNGNERARAKQRAGAEATARGADLARARAKASKSRRTEA